MVWRITADVRLGNTNQWLSVAELHETDESMGAAMHKLLTKLAEGDAKNIRFTRYSKFSGQQEGHAGYVCVDYGDDEEVQDVASLG